MRRARLPLTPAHVLRLALPAALVAATLVTVTGSSGTADVSAAPRPFKAKTNLGKPVGPEYDAKSVLVKFKPKATTSARKAALAKVKGKPDVSVTSDVVTVTSDVPASDLLKKVKADPSVELASLNYMRHKFATPTDPFYVNYQKYLPTVRLNQAWDLTKSAGSQTIAVLDTGVDAGHPDLAGHLLPGYNLFNTATLPNDGDGHGTAVAGIIAAGTSNGIGIAGVAWNAKIRPVKVLDDNGNGSDGKLVMGINWAVKNGARVINMSLGGGYANEIVHDAIKNAVANGVLVVAAVGNDGTAEFQQWPAAYPEVLSVGATDRNGVLTSFSSPRDVDVVAPGFGIASTAPRALTPSGSAPYYTGLSGTSFSAAVVSGVAALVRNKWPSMTPAQVIARLQATARDAGPRGVDQYYGSGVLDAYNALGGTWAPDFAPGTPDTDDQPARATSIELQQRASGNIGTEGDVDWYKMTSTGRDLCISVTMPEYDSATYAQNLAPALSVYDASLKPKAFGEVRLPLPGQPDRPGVTGVIVAVSLPDVGPTYFSVRNHNGARDTRAYTVDSYICDITPTSPVLDSYPALDAAPGDQSFGAPLDTKPSVTFARPALAETVNATTVRLTNARTNSAVAAAVEYEAATNRVTVTPTTPLLDNTPYRITAVDVKDTSYNWMGAFSSLFTTVDLAPGKPDFAAGGAYLAANLSWKIAPMSDLDQVIVRRNSSSVVPALTTGSLAYAGTGTAVKNTGLAQGTTYTYAAWAKDRSGKVSPVAVKQLLGMKSGISTTSTLINYGGSITLRGSTLRIDNVAYAGLPVNVYVRPKNSTKFTLLAALKTSSTGTLSVVHKPLVSSVYMLTFPGNASLMGTRTADVTVQVRPTISATLSPSSIRLGGTTAFSGYVAPAHYGQTVYLQQYGNKVWKSIASVKLSTSGKYAFGIRPAIRGQIAYRVYFPGDADHAPAYTVNKILTIS
ncbi:S8 family serine peptidase [Kribbella sp. VKM Ac-2566]|uniref:S8 family serine peptidase n=1 Tax=Kribbella sp. VKM Ac-2566 TaxID=2512218 RepID=UPI0010E3A0F9|nr:S8 family serine peptidase [Kribbella sp. VKM Ac-2566]TDW98814.1 type VII secretion-associated serine protease mycosin [Kribbella sp. VKM Ac-2566]